MIVLLAVLAALVIGTSLLSAANEKIAADACIVATGGLAQFITPLCKHEIILEKDLLLKGLNIIYKKNKK